MSLTRPRTIEQTRHSTAYLRHHYTTQSTIHLIDVIFKYLRLTINIDRYTLPI